MKVLISSLIIFLMSGGLSAGFAQANPPTSGGCDPPPDQPKNPPKK